jgi:hypothetical protein
MAGTSNEGWSTSSVAWTKGVVGPAVATVETNFRTRVLVLLNVTSLR